MTVWWRMLLAVAAGLLIAWALLPRGAGLQTGPAPRHRSSFRFGQIPELLRLPQFWVVCGLSFALTLMRETFNTWTVDFFKTEGGPEMSNRIAAFLSTPFDALGAVGIVALGWVFGRISRRARCRLLFLMLLAVTVLIYSLPALFHRSLWLVTGAVGVIGFLSYGPYSLLAGILAVEIRGKDYVGTVAGVVDGTGYLAGFLAGGYFGRVVDLGGYRRGFECLAVLTLIAALLSLVLYPRTGRLKS